MGQRAAIGRPIWNTRLYVLDGNLAPQPVGVAGELYISGAMLARGYVARHALTSTRFVADPYGAPGSRMYRTGDRVCWRPDGEIAYLGRVDRQIKLRGFRVELGEVEAALCEQPGVEGAVVVVTGEGDQRRLVGYVVPEQGALLDGATLRDALQRTLPDFMVPVAVVAIDVWPLTPNGKIDVSRPTEVVLAQLFAETLQLAGSARTTTFSRSGAIRSSPNGSSGASTRR